MGTAGKPQLGLLLLKLRPAHLLSCVKIVLVSFLMRKII